MDPVINKTGRAVVAICVLVFCCCIIVWMLACGSPTNGLHQSGLTSAWWVIGIAMAALGLNVSTDAIATMLGAKKS